MRVARECMRVCVRVGAFDCETGIDSESCYLKSVDLDSSRPLYVLFVSSAK